MAANLPARLALVGRPRNPLRRQRHHRFHSGPSDDVNELLDYHLRLLDQINHRQKELAILQQEAAQLTAVIAVHDLVDLVYGGSLL